MSDTATLETPAQEAPAAEVPAAAIGMELKATYYRQARDNLRIAKPNSADFFPTENAPEESDIEDDFEEEAEATARS